MAHPGSSREPIQPNAETRYEVRRRDLPLHCPMKDMRLWDSHPRVYIALENAGDEERCPYCGAVYVLKE